MKPQIKRCAIYTRKSTEEGLDMEFNSLDAQREACAAYIMSQKAEGWVEVKANYDDGGYSGGNIDRPALKRLIADIEEGKINIVVVYKIDRLTRSLMDFAKLVETFDKFGVTFVSVTQSFNTTTSMGRLTLNVLLSFAQFEREVIGERVRDKIAASKQKGMWMGGNVPIGYNVDGRSLVPDKASRKTVEYIFDKYLELRSVSALKRDLELRGLKSREWASKKGVVHSACHFSRGLLYKILRNPIYIGKIAHKGKTYEGQHQAIIKPETWQKAQEILVDQSARKRGDENQGDSGSLLKGKIFDRDGNFYSPTYTVKNEKRYQYYINQAVLQYRDKSSSIVSRFPAHTLEEMIDKEIRKQFTVSTRLADLLCVEFESHFEVLDAISQHHTKISRAGLLGIVHRVVINPDTFDISLSVSRLIQALDKYIGVWLPPRPDDAYVTINFSFEANKTKIGAILIQPQGTSTDVLALPPEHLERLVQGIVWRNDHFGGKTIRKIPQENKCSEAQVRKLITDSLDIKSYRLQTT